MCCHMDASYKRGECDLLTGLVNMAITRKYIFLTTSMSYISKIYARYYQERVEAIMCAVMAYKISMHHHL